MVNFIVNVGVANYNNGDEPHRSREKRNVPLVEQVVQWIDFGRLLLIQRGMVQRTE